MLDLLDYNNTVSKLKDIEAYDEIYFADTFVVFFCFRGL